MSRMLMRELLAVVGFAITASVAIHAQEPPKPTTPSDAVAIIGNTAITAAELDTIAKERLAHLRAEEYAIRKAALDDYIVNTLIEREAAARGISARELTRLEVDANVTPVTDDQKRAVYESTPSRFSGQSEAEAMAQIESNLRQVRLTEARKRFVGELRVRAGVRVLLQAPRVAVDAGQHPGRGPEGAPVTIVEFSDFQCPYCRMVTGTMKRLEARYGNKVRFVFRDFPLPIHKDAPKAAEAASCANEQGKFWPMHDKLFENQSNLQVPDLKQRAVEVGLNATRFSECLDSGKYATAWQQDRAEGQRYGVSATPTFFINGRMLSGARPYEAFSAIIDEELDRAGPSTSSTAGVKKN